ncbi:AimR family lysis-lysogeny pheromone receptor [Bacillus mycoides]|uniref:AimR family lysis-lysogeny pheromone receptor n=1 Tax=Bacillus mycoides TaxID=1405 RepID=UPI002DFA8D08|nr:AimR family lysis-lysogeny pheromone receptor [Bacillus mycoides]
MTMILEKIHKDLSDKGITNRQLAAMFDISHSKVNESFTGKREFDFYVYTEILNMLYPHDYNFRKTEVLKYCEEAKRKVNLRVAFEYLDMCGELEILQYLIDKEKDSNNILNRKFANGYELLHLRNAGNTNPQTYLKKVKKEMEQKKSTEDASKIPMDFSLIYAFFDYRNYNLVSEYTNELLPQIDNLKNSFLRSSYKLRTMELLATSFHRNNELEKARELCNEMIARQGRVSLIPKATAYCIMGETYILTDYELSKYYLDKGLQLMMSPNNKKMLKKKEMIQTTLDFLNIHFEIDLDNIKPKNPAELAYKYVKKGLKEQANNLIEGIKKKNGFLTPLQIFIQALARDDMNLMREALLAFERNNDLFYAELPKNVLKLK